jgi:hypothetical protein
MSSTKHSPIPWIIEHADGLGINIVDSSTESILIAKVERQEDATFIVRACNARDELLEALKLSLRNAESAIYMQPAKMEDSTELKSLRTWRDILTAAITKATA